MEESSIILLGLSQTYLNSDRCAVEWKLAAGLAERKQATVIMGAVKPCSRPDPLKKLNLMYLDFVDHKKESVVWKVLVDTIGKNSVLFVSLYWDIYQSKYSRNSLVRTPGYHF